MSEPEGDEDYPVPVQRLGVQAGIGSFVLSGDEDACRLTFRLHGRVIESVADDFFQAMQTIRRTLEEEGYRLICYGASRSCYPSGMSRDMGQGMKAYRLHLGLQARISDLVNIFSSGPDVDPSSVDEQEEFHQRWLASLEP